MMYHRRTTLTRPDRDRLLELSRGTPEMVQWAIFLDELRQAVERARVVDAADVHPDVVTMHSTVRLRDLASGREEEFTLVYPGEADLSAGRLSVLAALGTALLGTRAGDIVWVNAADGPRAVAVEAVPFQPEAAAREVPADSGRWEATAGATAFAA